MAARPPGAPFTHSAEHEEGQIDFSAHRPPAHSHSKPRPALPASAIAIANIVPVEEVLSPVIQPRQTPVHDLQLTLHEDKAFYDALNLRVIIKLKRKHRFQSQPSAAGAPANRIETLAHMECIEDYYFDQCHSEDNESKLRMAHGKLVHGYSLEPSIPNPILETERLDEEGKGIEIEHGFPLDPDESPDQLLRINYRPPDHIREAFIDSNGDIKNFTIVELELYLNWLRKKIKLLQEVQPIDSFFVKTIKSPGSPNSSPGMPMALARASSSPIFSNPIPPHNLTEEQESEVQLHFAGPALSLQNIDIHGHSCLSQAAVLSRLGKEHGTSYFPVWKPLMLSQAAKKTVFVFNCFMGFFSSFKAGIGVYGFFANWISTHNPLGIFACVSLAAIGSLTSMFFYYQNMRDFMDDRIQAHQNKSPEYSEVTIDLCDGPDKRIFPDIRHRSNWRTIFACTFGFGYMIGTTGMVIAGLPALSSSYLAVNISIWTLKSVVISSIAYMGLTTGTRKAYKVIDEFNAWKNQKDDSRNKADEVEYDDIQLSQQFLERGFERLGERLMKKEQWPKAKVLAYFKVMRGKLKEKIHSEKSKTSNSFIAIGIVTNYINGISELLDKPEEITRADLYACARAPRRDSAASAPLLEGHQKNAFITGRLSVRQIYLGQSFWREKATKLISYGLSGLGVASNVAGAMHLLGLPGFIPNPIVIFLSGFFTVSPFSLNIEASDRTTQWLFLEKLAGYQALSVEINPRKYSGQSDYFCAAVLPKVPAFLLALLSATNGVFYTTFSKPLVNSSYFKYPAGFITAYFMTRTKIDSTFELGPKILNSLSPQKPLEPPPINQLICEYQDARIKFLVKRIPEVKADCDSRLWTGTERPEKTPDQILMSLLSQKMDIDFQAHIGLKKPAANTFHEIVDNHIQALIAAAEGNDEKMCSLRAEIIDYLANDVLETLSIYIKDSRPEAKAHLVEGNKVRLGDKQSSIISNTTGETKHPNFAARGSSVFNGHPPACDFRLAMRAEPGMGA